MSTHFEYLLKKKDIDLNRPNNMAGNRKTDLMVRIRSGDAASFEALFYSYCQALVNFSRRYVKSAQAAENIVQDVFLRIWSNRKRLDPELKIKSYLYQAVKNQSLQQIRHSKIAERKDNNAAPEFTARTPEDSLNEKEFSQAVHAAVCELPPKCRMIFCMNRFDHLTYAEIAEVQNISIKTVETQMSRALKSLRRSLADFL